MDNNGQDVLVVERPVVISGGSAAARRYAEQQLVKAAKVEAEEIERRRQAEEQRAPLPANAVVAVQVEPTEPIIEGPKDHWLYRFYNWLAISVILNAPNRRNAMFSADWWWNLRSRRALVWLLAQPTRVYEFLRVEFSGNVSDDAYKRRMDKCSRCRLRRVRIMKPTKYEAKLGLKYTQRDYCSQCGCPEWGPSELQNKNRKAGWHCPARKHDGPYPDDGWRLALPVEKRGGGCKGCGGGK